MWALRQFRINPYLNSPCNLQVKFSTDFIFVNIGGKKTWQKNILQQIEHTI